MSIDTDAAAAALFCPICKEPISSLERGANTPTVVAPAGNAVPWWIGDATPPSTLSASKLAANAAVVMDEPPLPATTAKKPSSIHPDKSIVRAAEAASAVPAVAPASLTPRLSGTALVAGVLAFALLWLPGLLYVGLVVGALGLLLAGLSMGLALAQGRGGVTSALAAAVVNVQAIVMTVFFLLAPAKAEPIAPPSAEQAGQSTESPQSPQEAAPMPTLPDLLPLLKHDKLSVSLKDSNRKVRQVHVTAVGEVGRHLLDSVGDLAEKLNDDDAGVRAAAAEALDKIGPLAKGAYPRLLHASKNDPDKDVRRAAQGALERIGSLSPADATLLTHSLKEDANADFRASVAQALLMIGALPEDTQQALRTALKDRDVRVRVFAAQALWINRHEASKVVEVLRAALRDGKDPAVQAGAAYALGSIGKPAREAIRELKEMLMHDGDSEARLRAAEALYLIADDTATVVPQLRKLLSDKTPTTRGLAAEALGRIGSRSRSAVEDLRGLLLKDEPHVRACAAYALGGIGKDAKEAVPDLLDVLKTAKGNLREQIVAALAAIGPDAVEAVADLIDILHRDTETVRARAAYALGAIGRGASKAVAPLSGLLKLSRDPGERLIFAQALWRIDPSIEETMPVLLDILGQRDARLRLAAIAVLSEMGAAARIAVPALLETQKNATEDLTRALELAWENIGAPAKDDIPDLRKALLSANASYRLAAVQTLILMGADAADAVPSLMEALKINDTEFRVAIVKAFGEIGSPAEPAIKELRGLLKSSPPKLQIAVSATLGVLGDKAAAAVPELVELLSAKDVDVRTAALEALGAMGSPALKAVPAVTRLLKSDEHVLRANAAYTLGSIGREPLNAAKAQQQTLRDAMKNTIAPLKDAAVNDSDASVRLYAAQSLYIIARQTPLAVAVLKKCLMERDEPGVRAAAAEALGDIGTKCREADKEVVPLLVKLWKTDRDEVRRAAFDALKKIAPSELQPRRQ